MTDVSVLNVLLHGHPIGTLTRFAGDRTLFAFNEAYINNRNRDVLSLSFKDMFGELITDFRPTQRRVLPFFSNVLPEGHMREYLAERAGVNSEREFFLLWMLGQDLPGALTITPADGEAWPPEGNNNEETQTNKRQENALRFSLAGVQLKFSAVREARGGLTIPATGVGGSWIIKLPSREFEVVPENEFSMMTLAGLVGINVPRINLVPMKDISGLPAGMDTLKGQAFTIERFDRTQEGTIHIEDFAQIFGVYPEKKYAKASTKNIAEVIGIESSEEDIAEFIRRVTFNVLIGNADMHLKNWSVIYRDRRTAQLAPAYDFVSTISYIPDENAALKFSRTKRFDEFTYDELSHLAAKARLPEKLILKTAKETVEIFHQHWEKEKTHLPLHKNVIEAIEAQLKKVPIAIS